jgi:hypothetical protein
MNQHDKNETQKWNHGFVSHAISQYEDEQLRNLKSMEKYRGVIEDADYRSASPTFKERVILADQTYLEGCYECN